MPAPSAPVDLTNCDREPIHLLGAIQPFGFLIAVSTPDWFVQRASANVSDWLKVTAPDMVSRSLLDFIHAAQALKQALLLDPEAKHPAGRRARAIVGRTVSRLKKGG